MRVVIADGKEYDNILERTTKLVEVCDASVRAYRARSTS